MQSLVLAGPHVAHGRLFIKAEGQILNHKYSNPIFKTPWLSLASLAAGGITKAKLIEMVKERGYDISPVTDNTPFFYKFDVGTPRPVALALWAFWQY